MNPLWVDYEFFIFRGDIRSSWPPDLRFILYFLFEIVFPTLNFLYLYTSLSSSIIYLEGRMVYGVRFTLRMHIMILWNVEIIRAGITNLVYWFAIDHCNIKMSDVFSVITIFSFRNSFWTDTWWKQQLGERFPILWRFKLSSINTFTPKNEPFISHSFFVIINLPHIVWE